MNSLNGLKSNLIAHITERQQSFSKGQKRIAQYIIEHYDQAAFMTAYRLGETVGVSESTVVRFAAELGFEGYPQLQKAMQELIRSKLTSVQRIEVTRARMRDDEVLDNIIGCDLANIRQTLEELPRDVFYQAADALVGARRVYIFGAGSCRTLASFMAYYLKLLLVDVQLIYTNSETEIFEDMLHINAQDVIVGFSFPRYSMRTLKALEFASNRKAKVITLTDSVHSPMTLYSSCNLIARSDMASIVDSLVAPLSVVNALVVALCMKKQDEVITTLETLERIWDEYQVYRKD